MTSKNYLKLGSEKLSAFFSSEPISRAFLYPLFFKRLKRLATRSAVRNKWTFCCILFSLLRTFLSSLSQPKPFGVKDKFCFAQRKPLVLSRVVFIHFLSGRFCLCIFFFICLYLTSCSLCIHYFFSGFFPLTFAVCLH